jgi:serine phosphatase RsbU (regulator of sigma subunit)
MVLADFLYRSKDLLSGDLYSARRLGEERVFFVILDGMGKGLSASLMAMMSMAFLNHLIDTMMASSQWVDLKTMLEKALAYFTSILLDEEILSAIFLVVDPRNHTLEYASFSMPPVLLMSFDGTIESLRSNNPPINAFFNTSHTTQRFCLSQL